MQNRGSFRFGKLAIALFIIEGILVVFLSGVYLEQKRGLPKVITVGCWRKVTSTERAIAIRVESRDVEEMVNTARHEICHEIHYRLDKENFAKLPKDETEYFAQNCNPEEYLETK